MNHIHLNRFLSYRVDRVSDAVSTIVSQVYEREVKLSLRELRVLRTINSAPGIVHSEIVERVLFEKSLVSRLISGLVKKIVSEARDRQDRRAPHFADADQKGHRDPRQGRPARAGDERRLAIVADAERAKDVRHLPRQADQRPRATGATF